MKIFFLWVDGFKKLQDFSINLSSDYQYYYDDKSNELTREKKDALPDLFWGKNISAVTGILGANGAGKTTLLEFLCLALKGKEDITSRYFIIYEKNNSLHYSCSDNFSSLKTKLDISLIRSKVALEDFGVVFFSNVYDESSLDLGHGVEDVSVNKKSTSDGWEGSDGQRKSGFINQLDFVTSDKFLSLDYSSPETVAVKISNRFWNDVMDDEAVDENLAIKMMKDILHQAHQQKPIALACMIIKFTLLTKLYSVYSARSKSIVMSVFNKTFIDGQYHKVDIDQLIAEITDVLISGDGDNFTSRDTHFTGIMTDLMYLEQDLKASHFKLMPQYRRDQTQFTIHFERNNSSHTERLARLISYIPHGEIKWAEISSGERAYVNIFSSIWNAINKLERERNHSHDDDILICIDEGDLYLHPLLQLEFLEKLVKTLPELSEGKIQLIITTHSPLLITDLPAQCVVVLTKDTTGKVITTQGKNTFGANIYDIYRHSFELVEKRTGNLSQNYINSIVVILDKEQLLPGELKKLKESLTIIGDRLLSYHIEKRISIEERKVALAGTKND